MTPENPMLMAKAPDGTGRKTEYDLVLVETDGVLVSADARLPNTLVRGAIGAGRIPELSGYEHVASEVTFDDSRLDIVLSGSPGLCYVEVKSVTLVENGAGLFPDAPTERGRKHVTALLKAAGQGHRAAVVFVIQRPDVEAFSPNWEADPQFCETLLAAARRGVEVYAYRCNVSQTHVTISDPVPMLLENVGNVP
jgi:sugar fermentation stimulation protein A